MLRTSFLVQLELQHTDLVKNCKRRVQRLSDCLQLDLWDVLNMTTSLRVYMEIALQIN